MPKLLKLKLIAKNRLITSDNFWNGEYLHVVLLRRGPWSHFRWKLRSKTHEDYTSPCLHQTPFYFVTVSMSML